VQDEEAAGMRTAVTSHEVARRAGVSQTTVSRVLSGSARVAASTRARVEAIAIELGYHPNAAARAMRSRRTGIVGVVVGRITNPFYPQLLDVLGRMLEERGLTLILWDASHGAGEKAALDALRQRLIDGLLFTTVTSPAPEVAEAIAAGAPIVLLNRNLDGVEADLVDSDNFGGSRTVARYLAEHDRRRVAVVGGPAGTSTATERHAGFLAGAMDLDLDLPDSRRFEGDFSHASGVAALERSIAARDLPDAIFCVNDLSALGVLDAARQHGIRVPDDLWVVGFDDIEMASWPAFDLTTVHQPTAVMAHDAIALLERRLADPGAQPQHHRLVAELVIRGSTGHATWPRST
jgi:LacI family transcriptional regulator